MNQNQIEGSKLVQETEASNEIVDMLKLWLNKAKKSREVKDNISVGESSGGTGSKKILIKNLNLEKIKKIEAIVKDVMNLYASDSESDKNFENFMNSLRHKD